MPEILQFINNNDRAVYQKLYEVEKKGRMNSERTVNTGNPSVIIRKNKGGSNELEVVKTYVLDNEELVRRACCELNAMRRIHNQNADICAAKLYEWRLICKDGNILASTCYRLNPEVEQMLDDVDPLKAAEKQEKKPFNRAQTSIKKGYERLMDEVSRIEIVMEYGVPLSDFMKDQESIEAPDQKIRLLFKALSDLHNIGIVHEDMKPSNIILVEKARNVVPVFIDFDVAALHNVYHIPFAPYNGSTPYYASPEQLEEVPCDPDTKDRNGNTQLTPKTDVYSMGVIAFDLLGTRLPEERTERKQFVSMHRKDSKVHEVLANALVTSPGTRYDAGGILNGLMEAMGEKPALNEIQADRVLSPLDSSSGRKKWGMIVAFAAILGVVILGVRNVLQLSSIPSSDSNSTESVSHNGDGVYQEGSGNVQGTNVNITIYHQYPTSAESSNADSITTTSPAVTSNAAETTMTGVDENGKINATNFSGVITTNAIINNIYGEPKEEQKSNSSPATNSIAETSQPTITTTKATTTTTAGVGVENGFAYSLENGTATITGYQGTATVVVIPESVAGVPVYAIGEKAFANKEVTSVEILGSNVSGVQRIEKEAFRGCTYLKQVILPISIKYIGPNAFTRNYDVESITIYYRNSSVGWNQIEKTDADFEKNYIETSFNYGIEW